MTFATTLAGFSPATWLRLASDASDASGNGHDGTASGGVSFGATGLVGDADTAATFDGTGAITLPNAAWMNPAGPFSVVMVAKPSALAWVALTHCKSPDFLEVTLLDTGLVRAKLTTTETYYQIDGGSYTAGAALLVGCSFDGSTWKLNVGGSPAGSRSTLGTPQAAAGAMLIGSYDGFTDFRFSGVLDEWAFIPSALTDSDFADLSAAMGGGGSPPTGTALTYDNDGYNYDGGAVVDDDPPVDLPPIHAREDIDRVHQSLPAPTLVDGRPT